MQNSDAKRQSKSNIRTGFSNIILKMRTDLDFTQDGFQYCAVVILVVNFLIQ
jgi:hypothetical protein